MPVWKQKRDDGKTYITIPLLNIETYGIGEDDCDLAINEAFQLFCISSEKHGVGIEKELREIGWEQDLQINNVFSVSSKQAIIGNLLQTGEGMLMQYTA